MHSLEPVVVEEYSALGAVGSLGIVIVGSEVRTIGEVKAIAESTFFPGMNFHPSDGLVERLTHKCRHFFNDLIFILHIDVDPE
jgi:hypothetical protein